ncbi:MAG: ABC transporter substrate-binding protein [Anaerolineales bacterium]|nr:ABC transporter substrate-binding protein [Anaerolineales bacterium]
MSKKLFILVGVLVIASMALAACTPETITVVETVIVEKEGETVVETVVVEVEVEAEAPVVEEAGAECCDAYRIAIFEEPVSLNYWNYLGPGSSVWTSYVVAGNAAALFTLSDQRFDFVTSLAKAIPEAVDNGDGTWSFTVEMVEGAAWSDGEAITADDVVFTQNVCKDLKLTQNWPNQCNPLGIEVITEAVDEYTVKFTYAAEPSLGTWQAGVALAPILPEHFWAEQAAGAYAFLDGVAAPEVERPEDCEAEDADADACDAWGAYDEAFTNARVTMYEADATDQPTAGGYTTDKWEAGAFVQRTANEGYYFKGAEIVEYEDGTWQLIMPDGTTYQLYGNAEGEEILRFTSGPYSPNIIFSIYGSQDAAFLALSNGEVDYVINPLGLARGLREQAERGEGIETYTNADYGMFYLAFNMTQYPQSEYEFRQAFDIVIDKEFVINSVLGGVVFPMYSTMPPGNGFWHNPDTPKPYVGLTRAERVDMAVQVLKDAGWTWTAEPYWDDDLQDVVPGEGLVMPNGEAMPEMTILGPGPAYDPIRATFNQWISEWARELGMPVQSELTGFNTILGPVFIDANYDMYILGWSLGNVAFPDYFESFWHSRNCTADTGNYNTPCLKNEAYDALVDEFMSTSDLGRAQELVNEMQVMLADLRPYITLFYKQVHDLAHSNVVFPYTENLGGIESLQGMQTDAQVMLYK